MHEKDFSDVIDLICTKDPRYLSDAYYFIREALDFAVRMHKKPEQGTMRHVSAEELLEGIRVYTLQEYGPMALTVLQSWGLTCTEDIGEVVFNLVESGKLGKTEGDRKEDFAHGFDFKTAFQLPFQPRQKDVSGTDAKASHPPETVTSAPNPATS
ncbi:MAG: hypothetical protein QGH42_00285 [Kiritimatiellia bacterium]|jgi:uncharacterized repeat protein (TIGR04138 family)|nr:hypothetical protein [Pseudomonadales bacterium]MDP6490359.1 hypothetical protein [Kiritimatiellia bacterium]MDP6809511.1 hypothetical protein [Kiritimatiellia bacterium]MDP7022673.1 hypothetical protein [Kiritimatiellia bacterium]